MTSWYSRAYSAATSSLGKVFSSEADGDTEDDTHVCRVLREYYTEQGRPFPAWLPPDPKAPPPPPVVQNQPAAHNPRFGNNAAGNTAGSTNTLSSLWGDKGGGGGQQQQQQQSSVPASLRRGPPGRGLDFGDAPDRTASAGVGAGGSAQDRFKKLYGGSRTTSPSNSGPFAPPKAGGGGGDGGGNYEDRFAPGNYNTKPNQPWSNDSGQRRGLPSGPRLR
jgi:hypothetical protein